MTKSMEALRDISYLILQEVDNLKHKDLWKEMLNTIKQDLEKLELIEALYNKSLKEMENIKDVDRELYLKYKALENENKELLVNKNLAQGIALKYKKVIEILKQYIQLDLECNTYHEIRMGREMIVIPQKEYDLLKEVLE